MKNVCWLMIMLLCIAGTAMGASVDPIMTKALSERLDNQEVQMLTVEYAPGESSAAHRHNAHTFVYVLEGSVEMQVAGGDPVTLTAGETFYESPDDVHSLSRNASGDQRAKFLVFFVKEAGAPATVPAQ